MGAAKNYKTETNKIYVEHVWPVLRERLNEGRKARGEVLLKEQEGYREPSGAMYMFLGTLLPRLRLAFRHVEQRTYPKHWEFGAILVGIGTLMMDNKAVCEKPLDGLKQYDPPSDGRNKRLAQNLEALNVAEHGLWTLWAQSMIPRSKAA